MLTDVFSPAYLQNLVCVCVFKIVQRLKYILSKISLKGKKTSVVWLGRTSGNKPDIGL